MVAVAADCANIERFLVHAYEHYTRSCTLRCFAPDRNSGQLQAHEQECAESVAAAVAMERTRSKEAMEEAAEAAQEMAEMAEELQDVQRQICEQKVL